MMEDLFTKWSGNPCTEKKTLAANGSNRKYYRLEGGDRTCIAAFNDDVRENNAFIAFSDFFRTHGLRVPEIYAVSVDRKTYLQSDLGDKSLYDCLVEKKNNHVGFDEEMYALYSQVLADLVDFQVVGRELDFSISYPREAFDRQSLQWDFNYFKYYFLKLAYVPFDEQLLENDFDTLIYYLMEGDCGFFLYRDFQPRNIMICEDGMGGKIPWYIDFQGGRRGAAQYDVASLLYSARSELTQSVRDDLFGYYTNLLFSRMGYPQSGRADFEQRYYAYVLARIMQAMGAYGYRGYFERKEHFLKSIPPAIANLRYLLENHPLPIHIPHLSYVLRHIVDNGQVMVPSHGGSDNDASLTVSICSFSYKKGVPSDNSGNGGGFIFDCRALPNPGRYPEYKSLTGKDQPVIDFLAKEKVVDDFLDDAKRIVSISVANYLERGFTNLSVSFGCTGGQHRSVYCAEKMAEFIKKEFPCVIRLNHREQN